MPASPTPSLFPWFIPELARAHRVLLLVPAPSSPLLFSSGLCIRPLTERNDLLTSQDLGMMMGRTGVNTKRSSKSWDTCLPPRITDFSRAVVYTSCWASQWDDQFRCTKQRWEDMILLGTNSKYQHYFIHFFDFIAVCFDWLGLWNQAGHSTFQNVSV